MKTPKLTMILGVILLAPMFFGGREVGPRQQAGEGATAIAREQRILSLIVKRNPGAAIEDFEGVPALILSEAARNGMDYRLVMAIIEKESEWRPEAVGSRGAIGLMQIMPNTGAEIARRFNERFAPPERDRAGRYVKLGSLRDARLNIRYGIAYLAGHRDGIGELNGIALRAYNRGPVKALIRRPLDRYAEDVALEFVRLAHTEGFQ